MSFGRALANVITLGAWGWLTDPDMSEFGIRYTWQVQFELSRYATGLDGKSWQKIRKALDMEEEDFYPGNYTHLYLTEDEMKEVLKVWEKEGSNLPGLSLNCGLMGGAIYGTNSEEDDMPDIPVANTEHGYIGVHCKDCGNHLGNIRKGSKFIKKRYTCSYEYGESNDHKGLFLYSEPAPTTKLPKINYRLIGPEAKRGEPQLNTYR